MAYGWEGEKVRLVPLDAAKHLENALAWFNDPDATRWTLIGDTPVARLAEEEFFKRMSAQPPHSAPTEIGLAVETLDGGTHIGFSGLHQIDWRSGTARTGTLIGDAAYRAKGYGSDAARVRVRYAFEVLGLRMLLSEVLAENTASIKMLKRAGYVEAGRIPRRLWKRGAYRDLVILYLERAA